VRLDSGELVGLTYGGEPRPEFSNNQYSGAQVDHLLITRECWKEMQSYKINESNFAKIKMSAGAPQPR
jgi:hypothetical protein